MKFAYLLACRCTRMDLWRTRQLFTSTCSKRCVEFPPDPTETCCSCREYVTLTLLSAQYFSVFCVILYAVCDYSVLILTGTSPVELSSNPAA